LVSHGGSIQQEEGHGETAARPAFLAGLLRSLHRASVSAARCCATRKTSDFLGVFAHRTAIAWKSLAFFGRLLVAQQGRQNTDAERSKPLPMLGNCGVR
jgi:hypothetical protein